MTDYKPNPDLDLVLERTVPVAARAGLGGLDRARADEAVVHPGAVEDRRRRHRPASRRSCASRPWSRPRGSSSRTPAATSRCSPNELLVFTSVMSEDFRPVTPANGAEDLPFTARIEITPADDGGTPLPSRRHARRRGRRPDAIAEMGFSRRLGRRARPARRPDGLTRT